MTSVPNDISVIESQKENIQPLPGGRSVLALVSGFNNGSTFKQRDQLNKQRQQFESQLNDLEDMDDPLEVFTNYIKWCHDMFPQGNNPESGLLTILEQCTSTFKDAIHYKNDPRYLKVWLEYGKYSDSPMEIFIYLAKKQIGNELALFYEEFAKILELNQKYNDAKEVYEIGINGNARPVNRLVRSLNQFEQRRQHYHDDKSDSEVKRVLTLKRGTNPNMRDDNSYSNNQGTKRSKFQVFNEDNEGGMPKHLFSGKGGSKDIGTIQLRKKENIINAKPWDGEVLFQQQRPKLKDAESCSKIPVFRDFDLPPPPDVSAGEDVTQQNLHFTDDKVSTIITRPGKKPECVNVNMELLYPKEQLERSILEILMLTRQSASMDISKSHEVQESQKAQEVSDDSEVDEDEPTQNQVDEIIPLNDTQDDEHSHTPQKRMVNDTFTIPLKDDDNTLPSHHDPHSPTITFYSRMANNEVIEMFNSASNGNKNANNVHDDENDNDDDDEKSDGGNSTNYDGFVTETIYNNQDQGHDQYRHNDHDANHDENNNDQYINTFSQPPLSTSSQTLSYRPPEELESNDHFTKPQIVDPLQDKLREQLLSNISPSIETYPGYNNTKTQFIEAIKRFRNLTDNKTKSVAKGGLGSIVNFCGDEIYSLKCELGQGGYGYVYLIENELGYLKALKAETNPSSWEFYILNQIHNRLKDDDKIRSRIIKPESIFLYKDECFLILNYLNQGNILDIVNYYRNKGEPVDEVLCVFITIELLKIVEKLHTIGIIHGDLKADNCMINFKNTNQLINNDNGNDNNHDNDNNWEHEKIILIDFGRSIDLTLFPEGTEFKSNFKADQQDCPQMNNDESWSYEADYYGIAAIIHTLLFQEYIKVTQVPNGKYKFVKPLKRYWQTELWGPLLEVLMNPYYNHPYTQIKYPLIDEMKYQRYKLETWLRSHDYKLMQMLRDIEIDFKEIRNN